MKILAKRPSEKRPRKRFRGCIAFDRSESKCDWKRVAVCSKLEGTKRGLPVLSPTGLKMKMKQVSNGGAKFQNEGATCQNEGAMWPNQRFSVSFLNLSFTFRASCSRPKSSHGPLLQTCWRATSAKRQTGHFRKISYRPISPNCPMSILQDGPRRVGLQVATVSTW